jgi:hypothetical protein
LHEHRIEVQSVPDELVGHSRLRHLPQAKDELFSLIFVYVIPRPRLAWSRSHRGLSRT